MTYSFTTTFADAILAPCLAQLCAEIDADPVYDLKFINLGEEGDAAHRAQGTSSDHNPFVIGPVGSAHPGVGYVRAIDLGGPADLLLKLRSELFAIYRRHDARIYPYGYLKGPDSLISDWPPGTGYHTDTGDEGHLHISVGIKDPFDPAGWIPALDSRAPWGIGTQPVRHPQEEDMGAPITVTKSTHPTSKRERYWITGPAHGMTETDQNGAQSVALSLGVHIVECSEISIAGGRGLINAALGRPDQEDVQV